MTSLLLRTVSLGATLSGGFEIVYSVVIIDQMPLASTVYCILFQYTGIDRLPSLDVYFAGRTIRTNGKLGSAKHLMLAHWSDLPNPPTVHFGHEIHREIRNFLGLGFRIRKLCMTLGWVLT